MRPFRSLGFGAVATGVVHARRSRLWNATSPDPMYSPRRFQPVRPCTTAESTPRPATRRGDRRDGRTRREEIALSRHRTLCPLRGRSPRGSKFCSHSTLRSTDSDNVTRCIHAAILTQKSDFEQLCAALFVRLH